MKIVLASSYVPFINGGARFIVEWLEDTLREHGHQVERFYLPFMDDPDQLLQQTAAFRMIDLSEAGDRLIAFRPPAHVLRHPNKVLWFIHHIRIFYDLWGAPHGLERTPATERLRRALVTMDDHTIREARRVFTNSQVVSDRLMSFNGVGSTPLYPPIFRPERFRHEAYGDEILLISRVEPHKRQHLFIEALARTETPVRLRLCGASSTEEYAWEIRRLIALNGLEHRVSFENRWVSEDEKAELLAQALAVAYAPVDEDGVGYPCLEGAHARKGVLTTTDSGAVLELVLDGENGLVVEPDPAALADAMDELWLDRRLAPRLGEANQARLAALGVDWSHVVQALTA